MADLRKIDALIQEHVYGVSREPMPCTEFRVTQGPRKAWDGEPDLSKEGWTEYREWERYDFYEERYWSRPIMKSPLVPEYSTSIELAIGVLEKLKTKNPGAVDYWAIWSHGQGCYGVRIDNDSMEFGLDLPEAICRHVLHVLGVPLD